MRASDGALDLDAFARLVDFQIDGGTAALVAAGSTGEAAALDEAEFSTLVTAAAERTAGRVPLVAGTGQQSTRATIERTRRARDAGAGFALVVTPPYVRPTQEGLYAHFSEVAEHGGLPVVLYNVPTRTGCDLQPATASRLAGHGNIVGIKEAVPDPVRMRALLAFRSDAFRVLSGDDPTCMRAQLDGADGVVSVAANVAPRTMAQLCRACAAGDADRAMALERALAPLFDALAAEPNPIPLKWALSLLGFGEPCLRLPLLPLSPAHRDAIAVALRTRGLVEAAAAVG